MNSYILVVLILRYFVSPQCTSSSQFPPGYTSLGQPIDIVTMTSKTGRNVLDMDSWKDKRCTTISTGTFKLPDVMDSYTDSTNCALTLSNQFSRSIEDFETAVQSKSAKSWEGGLGISGVYGNAGFSMKGSKSENSDYAYRNLKESQNAISTLTFVCGLFEMKMRRKDLFVPEFIKDVSQLPSTYDSKSKNQYMQFISFYGTHLITRAALGGRVDQSTSWSVCKLASKQVSSDDVHSCLSLAASGNVFGSINIGASYNSEKCSTLAKKAGTDKQFTSTTNEQKTKIFGGDAMGDILFQTSDSNLKQWRNSLRQYPVPIDYDVVPLSTFVSLNQNINSKSDPLTEAIKDYIQSNARTPLLCSQPCPSYSTDKLGCSCVCPTRNGANPDCCNIGPQKVLVIELIHSTSPRKDWADKVKFWDKAQNVYGGQLVSGGTYYYNGEATWDLMVDEGGILTGEIQDNYDTKKCKMEYAAKDYGNVPLRCDQDGWSFSFKLNYRCKYGWSGSNCDIPIPEVRTTTTLNVSQKPSGSIKFFYLLHHLLLSISLLIALM